jgi:phage-related protein
MPVVPVVTTTADTALSWKVGTDTFQKTVSAGTWEFPELELAAGKNTIKISGTGTTTFRYREGRL